MIKFKDMPYERPDLEEAKNQMVSLTERMKSAEDYDTAREVFLEEDKLEKHLRTFQVLANIRHDINTKDEYYDGETKFWDAALPQLQEYLQNYTKALLESPFRSEFTEEFGDLMFINAEIDMKSFSPVLIEDMQKENQLTSEYEDLLASAQVPFEGKKYTLPQMIAFKNDPDDERRLAAWKADGQWYKDNQAKLDDIYDQLVHLRDGMGKKLGYEGYTTLGYLRMGRNCYTKEDVDKFRKAVQKYVVPVAEGIFRKQAERIGKEYPMSFADCQIEFRSGNPKPAGTAEDIVNAGMKFYDELSPETSEFFHTMLDGELMDLLSADGKRGGGYCEGLGDYEVPFIFANFNGTQGDVEVITHEAGHAFEAWLNRKRVPLSYIWPTMEACECHSMSMEFFAEDWAEDFFGKDAEKYLYSHLAGAMKFIPYGTMVDHFQHIVYERPEMTPAERHAVWKELEGIYRPWIRMDGDIPFWSEGESWQFKHHIYSSPFYYIDYCLAQTVSLEFWSMIQDDIQSAWDRYMAYTEQGGSKTFTDLLKGADLRSPFDEDTLKDVCEKVQKYLDEFDLSDIDRRETVLSNKTDD